MVLGLAFIYHEFWSCIVTYGSSHSCENFLFSTEFGFQMLQWTRCNKWQWNEAKEAPRGVWGTTQTRQRVDQANISPQRERESETCVSFWGKTVVDKHYVRTVVWWKLKCFDQIEQIFVLSSFTFLFYFFFCCFKLSVSWLTQIPVNCLCKIQSRV